jgi:hypothetical protein
MSPTTPRDPMIAIYSKLLEFEIAFAAVVLLLLRVGT